MSPALSVMLAGVGFGFSLIVAIGAQNAFVLRQGLRREHILAVVAICAFADVMLIGVGVAGLGSLIQHTEWLLTTIELVGGVFLVSYGVRAALRAIKPDALTATSGGAPVSLVAAASTAFALTFLNPHVYLDTVVLLGSVAGTYGDLRWWFGFGAMFASIAWFTSLGFGARLLRPVFTSATAWRILDVLLALIMFTLGGSLLLSFAQHVLS